MGAVAVGLVRGLPAIGLTYGALGQWLPMIALMPVLFAPGTLMGYGARWVGGCTSGHGLCGVSILSPGSAVATVTFFATAVALTAALHVISGGAL